MKSIDLILKNLESGELNPVIEKYMKDSGYWFDDIIKVQARFKEAIEKERGTEEYKFIMWMMHTLNQSKGLEIVDLSDYDIIEKVSSVSFSTIYEFLLYSNDLLKENKELYYEYNLTIHLFCVHMRLLQLWGEFDAPGAWLRDTDNFAQAKLNGQLITWLEYILA